MAVNTDRKPGVYDATGAGSKTFFQVQPEISLNGSYGFYDSKNHWAYDIPAKAGTIF